MKRPLLFLCLIAPLLAMADGDVEWLSKTYDFGAFDEDSPQKSALFRFVNHTDAPVAIISARATCGCTTPEYDPNPVAPGDTGYVSVAYDASGRPGRFEKKVYVRTTASSQRTDLTIRGVVIGSVSSVKGRFPVEAGALRLKNGSVMLGHVLAGHAKMDFMEGYNISHDSIAPRIITTPDYIEATAVPAVVPPGQQMQFNLYFRADRCKQWGIVTDSILVVLDRITPSAPIDTISVPFVVIVDEDFSKLTPGQREKAPVAGFSSERIDMGNVPHGINSPLVGTVELTNRGESPLQIRRVYSEDRGVTVKASQTTIKKGKSATITVTVDPALYTGNMINARVTLITNDPASPTRTLRIVATRI